MPNDVTSNSTADPADVPALQGGVDGTGAVEPQGQAPDALAGEPVEQHPEQDEPEGKVDLSTVTDDAVPAPGGQDAPPPAPAGGVFAGPDPMPVVAGPAVRGLRYAVDIVFCIDVTGSMTPILDSVKTNALRFYDDVQTNLTDKGKTVDELRVRVIAFRDFQADEESALRESSFFPLPDEQIAFSEFVSGLVPEGGGDAPESGLEAVALAINSPWTSRGDRRRQVIVVWTDQPAHPLGLAVVPPDLAGAVPANFSALTDLWEDPQGPVGSNSKRLILFAPDGAGWNDISANWENVVHHPSEAGAGLSDVDYATIVDSIANSV